ncbi:uncharacterized protein LOC141606767 isoform X2 [Silene latifolia]|uniref:uncharacterized protein LOC141606767 isoform X2 n=1 Tax=Silene latifolia TaxID=37657 RepID=UPI003D773E19
MGRPHNGFHRYGGTYPVDRDSTYWDHAKSIAKQLTVSHAKYMDSDPVGPIWLLKADVYGVQGLMFMIIFRVKGSNGISVAYNAKVWLKPSNAIEVESFGKVENSERIPKDWVPGAIYPSVKKTSTKKMGKKGLELFKGLSSPVSMTSSELDCRNDTGKLRTRAFYILLEQIRSQRSWDYSRAGKCASTIWRKLPETVDEIG